MEAIKIENLNFFYNEKKAFEIKDISFSLESGKILGILGPNGSGKSTILKLISGIEKPKKGKIFIFGRSIWEYKKIEISKLLRWVGQEEEKKIPYKVFDFLRIGIFPLKGFFKKYGKEDNEKIYEILDIFSLKEKSGWFFEDLSGGEKRLIKIAFALVSNPEIILLDEPFAHLDPSHLKFIFSLIKKEREKGKTFLISSHEYNFLKSISDYLLLLKKGSSVGFYKSNEISKTIFEQVFGVKFLEGKIEGKEQIIPDIFY